MRILALRLAGASVKHARLLVPCTSSVRQSAVKTKRQMRDVIFSATSLAAARSPLGAIYFRQYLAMSPARRMAWSFSLERRNAV